MQTTNDLPCRCVLFAHGRSEDNEISNSTERESFQARWTRLRAAVRSGGNPVSAHDRQRERGREREQDIITRVLVATCFIFYFFFSFIFLSFPCFSCICVMCWLLVRLAFEYKCRQGGRCSGPLCESGFNLFVYLFVCVLAICCCSAFMMPAAQMRRCMSLRVR